MLFHQTISGIRALFDEGKVKLLMANSYRAALIPEHDGATFNMGWGHFTCELYSPGKHFLCDRVITRSHRKCFPGLYNSSMTLSKIAI